MSNSLDEWFNCVLLSEDEANDEKFQILLGNIIAVNNNLAKHSVFIGKEIHDVIYSLYNEIADVSLAIYVSYKLNEVNEGIGEQKEQIQNKITGAIDYIRSFLRDMAKIS